MTVLVLVIVFWCCCWCFFISVESHISSRLLVHRCRHLTIRRKPQNALTHISRPEHSRRPICVCLQYVCMYVNYGISLCLIACVSMWMDATFHIYSSTAAVHFQYLSVKINVIFSSSHHLLHILYSFCQIILLSNCCIYSTHYRTYT